MLYLEHHRNNSYVLLKRSGSMVFSASGRLGTEDIPLFESLHTWKDSPGEVLYDQGISEWRFDRNDEAERWLQRRLLILKRRNYWPGRHNTKFINAITNAPDEDGPREVYADWLLEHEDPRGELIVVQAALRSQPSDLTLQARAAEILNTHAAQLVSPRSEHVTLTWHLGFARSATFRTPSFFDHQCIHGGIRSLLRHPTGHYLRSITVPKNTPGIEQVMQTCHTRGEGKNLLQIDCVSHNDKNAFVLWQR